MLVSVLGTSDRAVIQILFNYLFRSINKYAYREQMPSREEAKALWARVQKSGYVLLNCKLYLYARHVAMAQGTRVQASAFDIAEEDVAILKRVKLTIQPTYKVLSLQQFKEAERLILTSPDLDLDGYMGRFINKKLKFLCRSYGLTMSGIKAEFIETALYALRKQYPFFKSELHMVNTCKTAISNCGQSTISYWTRDKRNALVREDDGTFSAIHVDVDISQSLAGMSTTDSKDDPHQHDLQALRALGQGLQPKARKFVELASGTFDAGFSLFIGENNDDAAHSWKYERYLSNVQEYLSVSEHQMTRLLGHLKAKV